MWKLVAKKEIVQGDMIALVHKNKVVSEGKVYLSVDGEYLGDPDYEFYKWESIPVKFDLNAFRGN